MHAPNPKFQHDIHKLCARLGLYIFIGYPKSSMWSYFYHPAGRKGILSVGMPLFEKKNYLRKGLWEDNWTWEVQDIWTILS